MTVTPATAPDRPWWQGAAIYQIYPRSFADANGDGIGDLAGITGKLDYVAALGVDAIWLSPFFTSPMHDFGYDVADYRDVDPIFGTLADFDALLARAHQLGLKVIIDQVWAHTSDQHRWFVESRSSADDPRADWYVWRDAKPDGSPPNNWQSVFGGPAWTWDGRRRQYYLHNFLKEQPQINGHHPAVQAALVDIARFWLDRGIDGFRIDAINFLMFDPAFTDNPPALDDGKPRTRPFDYQQHRYNQSHAGIPAFLESVRALFDEYPGRFTVAEVGGEDSDREMKLFTADDRRLNSAYGFDFLYAPALTPRVVADAVAKWPERAGQGWPSWAFENHDSPRSMPRWADAAARPVFARMKMLLLMCLRGNIFLYYGEELGLTQVDVPYEALQDPEAIANWPLTLSRDGARTPMPWRADAPQLGFGAAKPWLPLGADHAAMAVDRQEADPASLLHWTRAMLAFRKAHPALLAGAIRVVEAGDAILAIERAVAGETLLCVFNLSPTPTRWTPADPAAWTVVQAIGAEAWHFDGYGAIVAARVGEEA